MKNTSIINKFLKEKRGNIAMTFALFLIPVALAGGAALDYTQMSQKNSQMQNAVDAAALVAAKTALTEKNKDARKAARQFLRANLSPDANKELKNIQVKFNKKTGAVTVTANAEAPTSLLRLGGIDKIKYTPSATVNIPDGNVEIVLVLDSTGSMAADGKMDALKKSAKEFVDSMLALNNDTDRVKIGIVPFAKYVNVGLDNRKASWLKVDDDSSETKTVTVTTKSDPNDCTTKTYYDDGVEREYKSCKQIPLDEPYEEERTSTKKWRGCVGSRQYPLNLEDRKYNKKVPGLLNAWCPNRITDLTTSDTKLHAEIKALNPSGSTYIPTGLVWGLRAISSNKPFTDGVSYKKAKKDDTKKVIVLMSDGENQSSAQLPGSAWHNGSDLKQANEWTKEVCDNIKAEEIDLFTIGFGTTIPAETQALLKQCSTDGNKYLAAADGEALSDSFEAISSQLTQLYLSK